MRSIAIIALCALLAGCTTKAERFAPPPVSGPRFSPQDFDCEVEEPVPPASRRASAGAEYEADLREWGRGCERKNQANGKRLDAAGQVVR